VASSVCGSAVPPTETRLTLLNPEKIIFVLSSLTESERRASNCDVNRSLDLVLEKASANDVCRPALTRACITFRTYVGFHRRHQNLTHGAQPSILWNLLHDTGRRNAYANGACPNCC